ncbi:MAG: radical SAM protein, partial [Selenomonadaceae bacterium]|nr:radical SAM protein [Selenomonadaceae bacterium]
FSGGEPFCQAAVLSGLAAQLHENGLNIWCYSGYTYEQLIGCRQQAVRHLLQQVDVLVDGPYVEAQRDLTLSFRGSSNQRLIDVPASLKCGSVVLYQLATIII